jgi:signal transduction histidine kinase
MSSDDWIKSSPARAGGSLQSKPAWWIAFKVLCYGGFFIDLEGPFWQARANMTDAIRLLMVGDDPDLIELSQRALEESPTANFSVEQISTVAQAAQRLQQEPFDVLLLGLGLIESQEFDTLAEIRRQAPDLPIVVLTSTDDKKQAHQLLEQGAQDCLVKYNVTPELLNRSIDHAIHRQHSLTEITHSHARLKSANESLKEEKIHLTQQHDLAQQMVDNVSHDFRTPLTVIKEFAGIIHDGLAGEVNQKQKEFLDIVSVRADELALMVDDLLDISKLEAGMLGVWRREQRVGDMVEPIRQMLLRKAQLKEVRLDFNIADDLPKVYCDGDKIRRVLVNLTVNALKFAPPGSRVQIWSRYDQPQSKLLIGVTDQGPGISQDNLERIFTRFQQLEETAPLNSKSFGLGLTIARELVQLNLGELSVQSELGVGSTFSFDLPPADPRCLIPRFVRRGEHVRQGQHVVSTILAKIKSTQEFDASLVIDKFLQEYLRGNDLVLRGNERAWLVLVRCPQIDIEALITRLEQAWEREKRNSPQQRLPALYFQYCTTRLLDDDMAAISDELIDQYQRLKEAQPRNARVLLVDDDRDVVHAVGIRLQASGYEVLSAHDGSTGYRVAVESRPDAIIIDVKMRDMSGLTLLDKLRHEPKTHAVPIIMLSGSICDQRQALDMGASYFLNKPCDPLTLISTLQAVVAPAVI